MPKQLTDLAENGAIHHYKIDTGLFLLLFHGEDSLSDDHKNRGKAARDAIGKKPAKAESIQIARDALTLLGEIRREVSGPIYSAIYGQFDSALQDLTS